MRIACFGIPHIGGTYTVYKSLRTGLRPHGIEVTWLGAGWAQAQALAARFQEAECIHGEVVAAQTTNEAHIARALKAHLESGRYDRVLVNVLADRVQTNAVRYLAPDLPRVMVVHNITPGTYAAARAVRDWVHATVGVSGRIRDDLITRYGFDPERTSFIPNAVDLGAYNGLTPSSRPSSPRLRLLSLGRLEDRSKGIFWIADILAGLQDLDVTLTIVGDGPDRRAFEQRLAPFGTRVRFEGAVMPDEVPTIFAQHHVFVMPSRFEGFGQTIVEAMAAGCVPVVSRIRGVTDTIVMCGKNGLLFPVGDPRAAAAAIRALACDPARLEAMGEEARASVRECFTVERMAAAYAEVLWRMLAAPPPIAEPLPIERWSYPRGLKSGLRTYLPEGLKNRLRVLRERCAA